jgi:hypothetical protein
MMHVTLCLTIGRRPALLQQTLTSLLDLGDFAKVIAINDFRDRATNDMFMSLCPDGQLISLDKQLGHHGAVDFMYQHVTTPYVLHCEDDWFFDARLDIPRAMDLLKSNSKISQVCLRHISDFQFPDEIEQRLTSVNTTAASYFRLDSTHPQWHGYTFNPHIALLETWKTLGGFSQFKKERHISRQLREQGMFTAYIDPGSCVHIGDEQSVSNDLSAPSRMRLLRKKIKKMFFSR